MKQIGRNTGCGRVAPLALAVMSVVGLGIAGGAQAGCGTLASPADTGTNRLSKPAVYRPGMRDAVGFQWASFEEYLHPSMIGLWKVEFIAKGNTNGIPDGVLIDFGTSSWSSDGTETQISGGRAPSTGDVCMGAWEQTGIYTYRLNHIALAWQGSAYAGPTSIRENITLDRSGLTFHGTFTITAYVASATPGHEFDEITVAPPTPIVGVITGTRVTAD